MNCTSCGKPLAPGVAFCPVCGASTPYNASGQGSGSQYDPTEASSPYGSAQSYPPLPPTVAAGAENYPPQDQNPYGNYTNYGAQQQPPPYNPYGAPQPPQYGENPPLPPPVNPIGPGPYYNQAAMPGYPPMQPSPYGAPPKKRSKVGLIIGIVVLALVLLCGGVLFAAAQLGKSASTTIKNSIATATTAVSNVPANSDAIPAATKILFGAQTSSAIDPTTYEPTKVTTAFATGKDVDLTFQVNSAGKDGYIKVQWYEDGQQVASDILQHHAKNDHGYFGQSFNAAGNGAAALYWCTKANCSDAQLAQDVSFTVTATGAAIPTNTGVAIRDWKGTIG